MDKKINLVQALSVRVSDARRKRVINIIGGEINPTNILCKKKIISN